MSQKYTIGGTLYLTINGKRYTLTGDFSFKAGGIVREGVNDCNGVGIGFTKTTANGEFDATFPTVSDLSIRDLEAIEDMPMLLELANGRSFVSDTLYCTKVDEYDPIKGTVKASFATLGPMREA